VQMLIELSVSLLQSLSLSLISAIEVIRASSVDISDFGFDIFGLSGGTLFFDLGHRFLVILSWLSFLLLSFISSLFVGILWLLFTKDSTEDRIELLCLNHIQQLWVS
jgi:hypothetical protein